MKVKKGPVNSESVDEFDGCYQELKRKWIAFESKGSPLLSNAISYHETWKTIMIKDCIRGDLRNISGLGFHPNHKHRMQPKVPIIWLKKLEKAVKNIICS